MYLCQGMIEIKYWEITKIDENRDQQILKCHQLYFLKHKRIILLG